MVKDHVDHQSNGSSSPVNPVVSSQMNQALEDIMQIHHIKPKGSRSVGHHVVGFLDVKSGARLQELHLWDKKTAPHLYGYLEDNEMVKLYRFPAFRDLILTGGEVSQTSWVMSGGNVSLMKSRNAGQF